MFKSQISLQGPNGILGKGLSTVLWCIEGLELSQTEEDAGSRSGAHRALVKGEELYIFRRDTGKEELLAPFPFLVILPE